MVLYQRLPLVSGIYGTNLGRDPESRRMAGAKLHLIVLRNKKLERQSMLFALLYAQVNKISYYSIIDSIRD
jgi:hypothetical protein